MKPSTLKLTPVRGCNLNCEFCGIRTARRRLPDINKYKYMQRKLLRQFCCQLAEIAPKIRVEIAGFGEPLLHPRLFSLVSIIKESFQQASITLTTNGIVLFKHSDPASYVEELLYAGVNNLMVDCYGKNWDEGYEMFRGCDVPVYNMYDDNPKTYSHFPKKHKQIVLIPDLAKYSGITQVRKRHNMAGNMMMKYRGRYGVKTIDKNNPLPKLCTKPFRDITFAPGGYMPICCLDWCYDCLVGKFPEQSVKEIWYGKVFTAVRSLHLKKNRFFTPCNACDYSGGFYKHFLKLEKSYSEEKSFNILKRRKRYGQD